MFNSTNQVRLHLFVLAYNLGNFLRRLGLLQARRIIFQLAEVAAPRELFAAILERIDTLRPAPS